MELAHVWIFVSSCESPLLVEPPSYYPANLYSAVVSAVYRARNIGNACRLRIIIYCHINGIFRAVNISHQRVVNGLIQINRVHTIWNRIIHGMIEINFDPAVRRKNAVAKQNKIIEGKVACWFCIGETKMNGRVLNFQPISCSCCGKRKDGSNIRPWKAVGSLFRRKQTQRVCRGTFYPDQNRCKKNSILQEPLPMFPNSLWSFPAGWQMSALQEKFLKKTTTAKENTHGFSSV